MVPTLWALRQVGLAWVVLAASLVPSSAPMPEDPAFLDLEGAVGGPARAVFVQDHLAYVGVGTRLVVVDVADPSHPQRVGAVVLPDAVHALYVDGSHAYTSGAYHGGLRIVDVADPAAPREVGAYPGGDASAVGWADELVVSDGLAVLVWSTSVWTFSDCTLRIVDVRDPASPRLVADFRLPDAFKPGSGLALVGATAFVAGGYNGLRIVDISDPAAPRQIASVPARGYVGDVVLSGAYAFVVEHGVATRVYQNTEPEQPGVRVLDVRQPDAPREVAFVPTDGPIRDMVRVGDLLLCTEHAGEPSWVTAGGVRVIDVHDPRRPRRAAYYPFPAASGIGDGVLFAADDGLVAVTGTGVVDRGEGATPRQQTIVNGLWLLDASRPDRALPVVGQADDAGFASIVDVAIHGGLAYAAAGDDGFRVIARRSAEGPSDVGGLTLGAPALGVAVGEGLGYVTSHRGEIHVLDLSDPMAPRIVGHLGPRESGAASNAVAADGRAYVSVRGTWQSAHEGSGYAGGGLRIVDASVPRSPREAAWLPLEHVTGVALGDGVLVATDGSRLWSFDLSAGVEPPPLSGTWTSDVMPPGVPRPLGIRAVAAEGRTAYAALAYEDPPWGYVGGLVALHVAPGAAPERLGFLQSVGENSGAVPTALAVSRGIAYLTLELNAYKYYGWHRRLDAVDVSDPSAPVLLATVHTSAVHAALAVEGDRVVAAGDEVHFLRAGHDVSGNVVDGIGRGVHGARLVLGDRRAVSDPTGGFTFDALRSGNHVVVGRDDRLAFSPSAFPVTVPPDRAGLRFVVEAAPVSVVLSADSLTTTLAYSDAHGLPTRFLFPSGIVTGTATVTVTPTTPAARILGARYAAHAFVLTAGPYDGSRAGSALRRSVAVTIRYSDSDAWSMSDEASLALFRRDGDAWVPSDLGCDHAPAPAVDPAANVVSASLCRTGTYALHGPTRQRYLPITTSR